MSVQSGRSKTAETGVSVVLIIVLVLIAAGIFLKQFYYDPARLNIETGVLEQQAGNTKDFDPASLLPSGFGKMSEVESFDPDTLYVKINGKAELYLQSGFEKLRCMRFVSDDDENLWAEIYLYDMGTSRNAFAVFSTQRRTGVTDLSLTRFSYRSENALFLTTSGYYAEIVAAAEDQRLHKAMLAVAGNLIEQLPDEADALGELKLFPAEKLIKGSFKLKLTDVFGFEDFDNTFTAQYDFSEEVVTAFISKCQDRPEAKKLTGDYKQFLIDNGAVAKNALDDRLEGTVYDFYDTTEIILEAGAFVAGVHEAESQKLAEKLALMLKDKISGTVKK